VIKIKAIVPKRRTLDPKRQQQAIDAGLKEAADEAVKDFEATTSTWNTDVEFVAKQQKDGYLIGPAKSKGGDIWEMLNKGTKPHDIVAKKIALRFPGGPYRAKTRPGFIGSQAGGSSGPIIFRPKVHHPGTAPRGWSKIIRKKWQSRLGTIVQQHIHEAMR